MWEKEGLNRDESIDTAGENGDNYGVMKGEMRMKRFLCGILCLCLLCGGMAFAAAEEEEEDPGLIDELIDEELEEIEETPVNPELQTGEVYPTPTAEDFDLNSPALYTCKIAPNRSVFKVMDRTYANKNVLIRGRSSSMDAEILYVGLRWFIVRVDNQIGYVVREWVEFGSIKAVDPAGTAPFNVQKHSYTAVAAKTCHVRKNMTYNMGAEDDGNNYVILNPGTKLTVWKFYKGWAVVNYMREYGYIDPNELADLQPVSPTDEEMYEGCPIAAYTSYYKMVQTKNNISRIKNIGIGCGLISMILEPGQTFNGNDVMGPYGPKRGYEPAIVMKDGKDVLGYGGGTCQVSSTLYNCVQQLPGLRVDHRRAHGLSGATYLPIHCDAAVGTDTQNFIFTNMYDYPIRIDATSSGDGALSIRIYKVHN